MTEREQLVEQRDVLVGREIVEFFAQLQRLHRQLDPQFAGDAASIRALSGDTFPPVNVGATQDTIEVMALAPGVDGKTLDLSIDKGLLIISGERKSELPKPGERVDTYACERFAGKFRRVISLPDEVDSGKVDAVYQDGVLRITIAKRESSKPRRIAIN